MKDNEDNYDKGSSTHLGNGQINIKSASKVQFLEKFCSFF